MVTRLSRSFACLALGLTLGAQAARAESVLRIAMTASDIPLTTGQTDNGGEGMRFMGYTVYDGLINWDLTQADKASGLVPGLATSWNVAPDKTHWTFKLRQGVKFQDGSLFNADAVVWNFAKLLDDKSPQYDPKQAARAARASRPFPPTRRSTTPRSSSPPARPTRSCRSRSRGS